MRALQRVAIERQIVYFCFSFSARVLGPCGWVDATATEPPTPPDSSSQLRAEGQVVRRQRGQVIPQHDLLIAGAGTRVLVQQLHPAGVLQHQDRPAVGADVQADDVPVDRVWQILDLLAEVRCDIPRRALRVALRSAAR